MFCTCSKAIELLIALEPHQPLIGFPSPCSLDGASVCAIIKYMYVCISQTPTIVSSADFCLVLCMYMPMRLCDCCMLLLSLSVVFPANTI